LEIYRNLKEVRKTVSKKDFKTKNKTKKPNDKLTHSLGELPKLNEERKKKLVKEIRNEKTKTKEYANVLPSKWAART